MTILVGNGHIRHYRDTHPEAADLTDNEVRERVRANTGRMRETRENRRDEEARQMIDEANKRHLERRPRKYRNAIADHPEVVRWVDGYIDALPKPKTKQITEVPHFNSLFLYGNPGTGKTHQALGIPALLAQRGYPAGFMFMRIVDYLDRQQNAPFEMKEELYEQARNTRLLILDDLLAGAEHKRSLSDLYRLLDARFTDERPTVITCNVSGRALAEAVGERLTDRLREDAVTVKMVGESRRAFRAVVA